MREILFKAKKIDNGEWVEGLLTIMWGQYHIINPSDETTAYPIDVETICQYTGLTDKNGNKIWENDIIHIVDEKIRYIVEWHDSGFMGKQMKSSSWIGLFHWKTYEINMGNIFDNPELIN